MLYVGQTFTARLQGSVIKGVHCENCGCDYLYQLERTGVGKGSSPYYLDNDGAKRRAQAGAQRALLKALQGCDTAPCPECGWYQAEMVKKMRGAYTWLLVLAICAGVVAGFAMLAGFSAFLLYSIATF